MASAARNSNEKCHKKSITPYVWLLRIFDQQNVNFSKINICTVVEEDHKVYVHFWYYFSKCYYSHVFRETTF